MKEELSWRVKEKVIASGTGLGWVQYLPLLAAIFAPLSTLLDIPGLSQPWFKLNGENVKDPYASLILSSFSLAFNLVANALLVARFTCREAWWSIVMTLSVVCKY